MRFVQGIDYGPRKGTLGFAIHMAEGGDGTLGYLAQRGTESRSEWVTRVRGVSANFVILSTGETVQMVGWDRASGSMNPRDRSSDKAFYGARFIKAVLGEHYVDPNAWSLSVEVTGYRRNGPNAKQVDALVALVAEARDRFPTLRGAYGHADQTDTKGCPGTAATMRDAWDRIGHGLFLPDSSTEDPVRDFSLLLEDGRPIVGIIQVRSKNGATPHAYLDLGDDRLVPAEKLVGRGLAAVKVRLTEDITTTPHPGVDRRTGYLFGEVGAKFLLATDVTFTPYSDARPYEVRLTVGGKPVSTGPLTLP